MRGVLGVLCTGVQEIVPDTASHAAVITLFCQQEGVQFLSNNHHSAVEMFGHLFYGD